ncbi:MAG: flippase [Acidimicrobiia bacterium]|nr:flippase [Acidimicrobiia bacterium]
MTSVPGPPEAAKPSATGETERQIRGSSLLLAGKVISVLVSLVVQIVIVRELTTSEYGAFAYALSLVATASTLITLGIDRGITRFVAIYDEDHQYDKMFGTIAMQLTTIVGLGMFFVIGVIGLQSWISGSLIDDRQTVAVLLILSLLAPIQAFDAMMGNLFAVLAEPRSIFFRRNILTPAMRLAVAGLLLVSSGGPRLLAAGYVTTALIGAITYAYLLIKILRKRGLLVHAHPRSLSLPIREVMTFTLPLLTSELLFILINTSDAILLGRFGGTDAVAAYKVILPAAKMNQLVLLTFGILFTPLAARLFARNDREGIARLYWQTSAWVAVLSFPILVLTTSMAPTFTGLLFGAKYRDSWIYLVLVSFGYYFSAALGFNAATLKVLGRVRYIVGVSAVAGIVNIALNLVLISRYGPMGAAVSTLTTLVVYNLLNQLGLRSRRGIGTFSFSYAKIYLVIVASIAILGGVQLLTAPTPVVAGSLAAVACLAVFAIGRHELDISATFPELLQIPLVGNLLRKPGSVDTSLHDPTDHPEGS